MKLHEARLRSAINGSNPFSQANHEAETPTKQSLFLYLLSIKFLAILTLILIFTSFHFFFAPPRLLQESCFHSDEHNRFHGDLRDAIFPWNKLCFGPTHEKLKLAVFSKAWPIRADPGGMERHASTLYHSFAARGHEFMSSLCLLIESAMKTCTETTFMYILPHIITGQLIYLWLLKFSVKQTP